MKNILRNLAFATAFLLGACGLPEPRVDIRAPLPIELAYREAVGGIVVITGRVNDRADVAFILDTGAPVSVLIDGRRTAALGLDTRDARPLGDPADPATPVGVIQGGFRWTFGDVALSGLTAVVIPEHRLPCRERFDAVDFAGVIGADLFRRFVVEIDPGAKRVRLHDPATWRAPEGAPSLPVTFRNGHVYVPAKLELASGAAIDHELNVDTGSSRALSLVAGSHPALAMPVDGATRKSCLVNGTLEERVGAPVAVSLGGLRLAAEQPVYSDGARVSVQRKGAIGLSLFAGRRIAIDYPGRRIVILG